MIYQGPQEEEIEKKKVYIIKSQSLFARAGITVLAHCCCVHKVGIREEAELVQVITSTCLD